MILEEMLHASAKRVDEEYTSMMRRRACCAAGVILRLTVQTTCLPIGLVQNDEFVLSFRKSHLLLREQLDFLSNDVDASGKREENRSPTDHPRHSVRSLRSYTHRRASLSPDT